MARSRATPEGKVKSRVDALLARFDAEWVNPATWGMGASGKSDKIACVYGHYVAIEVKSGRNKPTALQAKSLRSVLAAGGSACVINEDTLGDLEVLFQRLKTDAAHHIRSSKTLIQPPHVNILHMQEVKEGGPR